jgi:hypothetical protein
MDRQFEVCIAFANEGHEPANWFAPICQPYSEPGRSIVQVPHRDNMLAERRTYSIHKVEKIHKVSFF